MKSHLIVFLGVCLGATAVAAPSRPQVDERAARREAIDVMAQQAVLRLCDENSKVKDLYGRSVGYAVFDSFKVALLLSGGGGVGVAVDRGSGRRTYMRMGTGGIGLGLGGQSYQVIFFFETREALDRFVDKGWQAAASANAAAGTSGVNAPATFSRGVAVYQLTNKGLMAQADVSGAKYWKSNRLNAE